MDSCYVVASVLFIRHIFILETKAELQLEALTLTFIPLGMALTLIHLK